MGIRNTTWKHIRRTPFHSMAAIITIFLTLLLGGFFSLITITSALVLGYFESKPQITVFFTEKAGKNEADMLKKTLEDTGKISSIKYVSKEDALNIYREQYKNDPLLLEMVTADILPASLEISAKEPSFLKDLEPIIRKGEGVEDVVYQKDVVDSLLSWTRAIRLIGICLAGILALDSLLIIITVIGMKIALRKEEIEILKLVGATPWYIRLPFLVEGGLYGIIGACFAWLMLFIATIVSRQYILSFLGIIPQIQSVISNPLSSTFVLYVLGLWIILSVCGMILGVLGSILSIGRYIKF